MAFLFDLPYEELVSCRLPQSAPADLGAFWEKMLAKSAVQPLDPDQTQLDYTVKEVCVAAISFAAFDGGRIAGWCITPAEKRPRPALIFYHGYSGNKTHIAQYLGWALQGFTCIALDVRGQPGDSSDMAEYPGGHTPGWLMQGILDPERYYFTRCYLDAVRAVDFACGLAVVDPDRIGVTGCSQGGGLSLAACCLDARPRLCMAEVPGFCHLARTLELTREPPWTEVINYLRVHPDREAAVMRTFSYVELNNLCERIVCTVLVNACHADMLCVPSSIYSVYNRIPHGDKEILYYPYNGHECGLMIERMIETARARLLDTA
jgi:cephalosporin-C deacetylase